MKTALSIAGSDSSGGAGIQADLKTFSALGVFGMTVITAVTAQNTMGVFSVQDIDCEIVKKQIDAVFTDIRPDSVKIGMTSSADLIFAIAERLEFYRASNIVLDPVMVSTSGSRLLNENAVCVLEEKLFPLASLITPNIPEAEVISGIKIESASEMEESAREINRKYGCAVLLKGGHSINDANDCFFDGSKGLWLKGKRVNNPNTHGTGCTLSSAIAANLALGKSLYDSIKEAKSFVTGALESMLNLGQGSGPLNHMWKVQG
ncbi:MAG: bifunctional hydroxymethylpyrimidine kinase/phosphomethylpyrimidine kinase [Treponema sp.]|nr:bifunctional hydroxymethylpyrimidine kinase/phosphomethylpyrimidine kinase [Treponema sp.]